MNNMKLFGLLAACCLALTTLSCSKDNSGNNEQGGGKQGEVASLKGTTWSTADLMGYGVLTLSFTDKDATLKRVSDGKTTTCTYPYTYSNGTMKTRGKLVTDEEQDVTGTVSGADMTVVFSKGGNFAFSKK